VRSAARPRFASVDPCPPHLYSLSHRYSGLSAVVRETAVIGANGSPSASASARQGKHTAKSALTPVQQTRQIPGPGGFTAMQ